MKNENKSLEQMLREVCEEACGSADVVLRRNRHRDIIKLFQKQATSVDGDLYFGWFGRLFKTSSHDWW